MSGFESVVEEAAIQWFKALGYAYVNGGDIAPDSMNPERADYGSVFLEGRLRTALARINSHLDSDTLDEVARKIGRLDSPSLEENNLAFHKMLTKGVEVQVRTDGGIRGDLAWLVDFENPDNNDWLVVNQLTIINGKHNRRPDLVAYLNGFPFAVIELKNPEDENATLTSAWNQLQTYKAHIPALFNSNEILVVSDGAEAKIGSLTAGMEWFGAWRTVDGSEMAADAVPQLQVLIAGVFEKQRLLDYLRYFIFWETDDGQSGNKLKKLAGYHQYHAVNKAVTATVKASSPEGDKRIGVVWHTQGSGKSISMCLYAGKIVVNPAMANPTLVVITDRNDLDGQLFAQFSKAPDLIPHPSQAESREDLRDLLKVASGGVVFTTIQKFGTAAGERMPLLSDRRNIVVIADEAHRSHYAFVEGFARNLRDALPNASFIGFTGTPIEFDDKSTPAVFGNYVDTYTISQSVEDKRTVPIYYEARLAKIKLPDEAKPLLDEDFEEVTEGEEEPTKARLKSRWARLEAMVGTEERLEQVAKDIVEHWGRRKEIIDGKAMVVVMSRRIAVDLYDQIVKLKPEWHSDKDEEGHIKVVMTGSSSDPLNFQPHRRNKPQQKQIEKRFKNPDDPLEMVIVRDMWLTGFDVPCAHTMYADKPMKGHGLMQAIARVNRVFKDKPSGLVVDYLGLAEQLRKAVGTYGLSACDAQAGGRKGEKPGLPVEVALDLLNEKFGIVKDMFHLPAPGHGQYCIYALQCNNGSIYIGQTNNLAKRWKQHLAGTASDHTRRYAPMCIAHYECVDSHEDAICVEKEWKTGWGRKRIKRLVETGGARQAGGFDYSGYFTTEAGKRLAALTGGANYILGLEDGGSIDGKKRFLDEMVKLNKAAAIAIHLESARGLRDELGYFQAVQKNIRKYAIGGSGKSTEELNAAIKQIISEAVASEGVLDVFGAAGIQKPDISILSDEFLTTVKASPHVNLQLELLKKLLSDEIKSMSRHNVVQSRKFSEMLERSLLAYQNRTLEAAEVILELINMAKEMRDAPKRGDELGLTDDELAFYDALADHGNVRDVMGDKILSEIAHDLVDAIRASVAIDWTQKESVRARMRTKIKRLLRKYGYPPDKREDAVTTVIEQAEQVCRDWAT